MQNALVPDERTIFNWIETIFARGVRRPGYAADQWTEDFCLERFRQLGLDHAANEILERDGELIATGHPEPRWWFTSRLTRLEDIVREAIVAEQLERSMILPPDVFGPMPTSDGGPFHLAGVPLVNFLTAPFYLFDAIDTLDKIHRQSLVPLTRAAIRLIASTGGVSPAAMRR